MGKTSGSQKVIRVEATNLDERGAGVAELAAPPDSGREAVALHVLGLLPGERADVQVEHRSPHARAAWGRVARRYNAAPSRVVPACPAYGRCGGCALQHLAYPAQVAWKARRLAAVLRGAGVELPEVGCFPSENEGLGGRSRAKLVAAPGGVEGRRVILGAYAPRSHEVIDLAGCRVATPLVRAAAVAVAGAATALGLTPYDEAAGQGALRYVLLRDTAGGDAQVSLVFAEVPEAPVLEALAEAITAAEGRVTSITVHENRSRGNALLGRDELPGAPDSDRVLRGAAGLWERMDLPGGPVVGLRVSPRSFLQVNRPVAARLYADVAAGLAPGPEDRLLDVYCGVGGIGLALAASAPGLSIVGIEDNRAAVDDAEAGARRAGAEATFRCGDAAAELAALSDRPPTICAVNPPRRGCDPAVLSRLAALAPRAIAYVSCDPDTLARDLGLLADRYVAVHGAAYDMHPHTAHVEALVLLHRR